MAKKIQVSFTDKQLELIENFKGELGESDSEVIRGIVIAWLSEKSFISTVVKNRIHNEELNKSYLKLESENGK